MRIGIVSDTHSREIPKQLWDDFKNVDLIIHTGDFCSSKDYKQFAQLKEVKAVYGNMDEADLVKKLPEEQVFQVDGVSIGLFHGEGPPKKVLEFVQERFASQKVDVVIFGHSHQACNEKIGGVLYFNPGSPNDKVCGSGCSYGILEIKSGKVTSSKIVKVKES